MRERLERAAAKSAASQERARFLKHWTHVNLRTCLRGWCEAARGSRRGRLVVARCLSRLRLRAAAGALDAWAEWCAERRRTRDLMRRVLRRLLNAQLQGGYHHWWRWTVAQRPPEVREVRVEVERQPPPPAAAPEAEEEETPAERDDRVLRRVIRRLLHAQLQRGFGAWRNWLAATLEAEREAARREKLLLRIRARWLNGTLVRAYGRWAEYREARRFLRRFLKQVGGYK